MKTAWKFVKPTIPVLTAIIVIFGTLYAVRTELTERAATEAYADYIQKIVRQARHHTGRDPAADKELMTKAIVAGAKVFLYSNDDVLEKVAALHDGGVFGCTPDKEDFRPMYEILAAMKDHVGFEPVGTIEAAHLIFCRVEKHKGQT
ncbi:MAG: hypothetical protein OXI74_07255 [Rhodospirillaceae bacterium]|nr:hypothetical protein [Rhodospirillaceae bacterium]